MKNVVLVLSAAWAIITTAEYAILKEEMQIQAEQYDTRLGIQEQKYMDELIEVRQELRGKQFEFDMATNRVEQLNKEIGGTAYESK